MTRARRRLSAALALALALAAVTAWQARGDAETLMGRTTLRNAAGGAVGRVEFVRNSEGKTLVRAHVFTPDRLADFHGFHIHANNDPSNGSGCLADPAKPSDTWFQSADGHLGASVTAHGNHFGDFPSILINSDGKGYGAFTTDRVEPHQLAGKAVMLHLGRDNYNNIPRGSGPLQYRANTPAAVTETAATGNAGDRYACGLITLS